MLGSSSQLFGEFFLFGSKLLQAHKLSNILHAVDDVLQFSIFSENRRVDRAPEPLLEYTAFGLRATDVILLHRHCIRNAVFQNSVQRRREVPDTGGIRIVWI